MRATEELREVSVDRAKRPTEAFVPPLFYFPEQTLIKSRPEFRQTLHSKESPTFLGTQSYPVPERSLNSQYRSASALLRPPIEVQVRPILRPPTTNLQSSSTLKAIRSASNLPVRPKGQAPGAVPREVLRFRLGRNVLNRLVSSTGRLAKQGKDQFELKWKVNKARNWSKSRGSVRQQGHQSFLVSLSCQSKLQKQHSDLQLEKQRFDLSQQLQKCRKIALRKREFPKQVLSIRNMGLEVERAEDGRGISNEEIRRLLGSRAKAMFR